MAWGRSSSQSGIDDLVKRIIDNDQKLRSLTILRFRRLNGSDVEALAKALHNNSILQELNCSSHSITADASAALGAMLQHNHGLKSISVGNSSWGDQAVAALASGLKHNSSLVAWDLEHKGLTASAAGSIADVLQAHPALQQLALSRNSLTDAGVHQLCAGAWKTLKHLELADCGVTSKGLQSLAAAASLAQLHHLDLSHNELGPSAADGLQQLVSRAAQLRALKLRNTALGGAGVAGLAKGLLAGSNLQHLDLSCTLLDDGGLAALAAALADSQQQLQQAAAGSQPPLFQLLLGGNPDLSDTAISQLAAALTATPAVDADSQSQQQQQQPQQQQQQQQQQQWHLDVSETRAGSEAVRALARVPRLQQLSLFGCKLGTATDDADTPVTALQACLAQRHFAYLQGLNLSGCTLGFEQLQSLMHQLAAASGSSKGSAPALRTLEIGANPGIQHEDFEGVVQQLRDGRPGLDVHWRVADSDAPPQQ